MILFHLTRLKNLESILIEGILPDKTIGLTLRGFKKHYKVFLTNDIEKIIKIQGGNSWLKDIAIISVESNNHKPHKYDGGTTYTLSNYEFVTDKILPSQILNYKTF